MAIVTREIAQALDGGELGCGTNASAPPAEAAAGRAEPTGENDERERRWRDRFAFPPLAAFPARFIR